jgi:hypothetical protein
MPTVLKESQVKSKLSKGGQREVVGKAQYAEFGSLAEAINGVPAMGIAGLGEEKVLALVNTQNKTNAMNEIRAAFNQKPTKQTLMFKALQTIPAEELASLQGDEAKLKLRVQQEMEKLEKEYDQNRQAALAKAKEDAKDADDDDSDPEDDDNNGE